MNENQSTAIFSESIWNKISSDLSENPPLQYQACIEQNGKQVLLDIDIDLGGGFEGGYELTTLSYQLPEPAQFRFAIHDQDFIDEIGKFFRDAGHRGRL